LLKIIKELIFGHVFIAYDL